MRIGKRQYELMRALVLTAAADQHWTKAQERVMAVLIERGLARYRKHCHSLTAAGQEALLLLLLKEERGED